MLSRADALSSKGEYDRAIADYDRVIKISPGLRRAEQNRLLAVSAKADRAKSRSAASEFEGRRSGGDATARAASPGLPKAQVQNWIPDHLGPKSSQSKSIPAQRAGTEPPLPAGPPSSADPNVRALISEAARNFNTRQFDAAISALNKALAIEPDNLHALRMRGMSFSRTREFDRAIADLQTAEKLKPDDHTTHSVLGEVWSDRAEKDKAFAAYSRAIELNPKAASALNNRGVIYRDRGDLDAALSDFDRAVALGPSVLHLLNRAIIYERKGELDRAIADYDQVLAIDPSNARAAKLKEIILASRTHASKSAGSGGATFAPVDQIVSQATALYLQRKYDEAHDSANRAIVLDPKASSAYWIRGLVRQAKMQFETAKSDFDEAVRLNPKDLRLLSARARFFIATKDYDRALAEYDGILAIDPKFVDAVAGRAAVFYAKGIKTARYANTIWRLRSMPSMRVPTLAVAGSCWRKRRMTRRSRTSTARLRSARSWEMRSRAAGLRRLSKGAARRRKFRFRSSAGTEIQRRYRRSMAAHWGFSAPGNRIVQSRHSIGC